MFQVLRKLFLLTIFASILTACVPEQTVPAIAADVQNTAVAIAGTSISLTQTAVPTATFTPTATFVLPTPSPFPTQPPVPIFTPDAIQVERWKEYQIALAKVLLSGYSPALGYSPDLYRSALCEWDILGRSGQEVYVWAYCALRGGEDGRLPAVIQLGSDGSVQSVKVPEINNSTWDSQILKMFPVEVREKIALYYMPVYPYEGRPEVLRIHLHYRREHPDEPPLVVLSATPNP